MRNFFKTSATKKNNRLASFIKRKPVKDILDTDEDRVINQYNVYLNYITRLRKDFLRGSAELIGFKRRVSA